MTDWLVYRGTGEPHRGIETLPPPPPWRDFDGGPPLPDWRPDLESASFRRLGSYGHVVDVARSREELELINAALFLRRPLLVTGEPGIGKSTLAHSIAHELQLGRVLRWPVHSRSTLRDGLYQYDAIGRLHDAQLPGSDAQLPGSDSHDIGRYLRLGPLGTALLPTVLPRVLLIDELDKGDMDLPNDLLNALEEGEFALPELERLTDRDEVEVRTDDGTAVPVRGGRVRCRAFPVVVMTSNDQRDFPAALLRR
ncbi:AAA family ATPase, partial [Streptomyces sp. PKU-EA00015]|uniref:AAA family ATPase n=1 Tax=Streptomyces sp. PKU-EA00015 TaxID=2748326 RepID=UPI0015A24FB0